MITVKLSDERLDPRVEILTLEEAGPYDGARFALIEFGQGVEVVCPGYNEESVRYLRRLRDALTATIGTLELSGLATWGRTQ